MASATPSTIQIAPVDADERRRAVESALGSLRIEGIEPDKKELEIVERFARGEIDLATLDAEMNAYIETDL